MMKQNKKEYGLSVGLSFLILTLLFGGGCNADSEDDESSVDSENDMGDIADGASIIAIGDSVMFWNSPSMRSIPHVVGDELGAVVYNGAVSGAYFVTDENGWNIPDQYVDGDWEWLILDGGANDFNDVCGCGVCDGLMDEIITEDGSGGALPKLVDKAASKGTRVVLMGYYEAPEEASYGFDRCNDVVSKYSARLSQYADETEDVWFVDAAPVIDSTDLTLFDFDKAHPSQSGSQLIGQAIAEQIKIIESNN